jgi:hypothetical protein
MSGVWWEGWVWGCALGGRDHFLREDSLYLFPCEVVGGACVGLGTLTGSTASRDECDKICRRFDAVVATCFASSSLRSFAIIIGA